MIVVDASAWFHALSDPSPSGVSARSILAGDDDWVVPPHAQFEVIRTLRRLEATAAYPSAAIDAMVQEVVATRVRTVPADPEMLGEVWALRHAVSMYDAPYVAVATRLDVPLVTMDLRLARTARVRGVETIVPGEAA